MPEHIKINIKDGVMKWTVRGVKGNGCHALTGVLRKMSSEVLETKATDEANETPVEKNRLTNGFGNGE